MLRLAQRAVFLLFLSMGIPSIPMLMAQQQPMPSAPILPQVLAAKRVFISNGGDDDWTIPHQIHAPNLTYNQFYADIKSWGKYELVSAPTMRDRPASKCTFRSLTPKPTLPSGRSLRK